MVGECQRAEFTRLTQTWLTVDSERTPGLSYDEKWIEELQRAMLIQCKSDVHENELEMWWTEQEPYKLSEDISNSKLIQVQLPNYKLLASHSNRDPSKAVSNLLEAYPILTFVSINSPRSMNNEGTHLLP